MAGKVFGIGSKVKRRLDGDAQSPHGYYELEDGRVLPARRTPKVGMSGALQRAISEAAKIAPDELDGLMLVVSASLRDDASISSRRLSALLMFAVWCKQNGVAMTDVDGIMETWGQDADSKSLAEARRNELSKIKKKLVLDRMNRRRAKRDAKIAEKLIAPEAVIPAPEPEPEPEPTGLLLPGDLS